MSGDQAKHQRDERCTAGLTEQASRAQHAARTAAAVARCRGDDRAVVRSLEQAETASAQGHAPNNVAVARVRGKYAEQEQSAGEIDRPYSPSMPALIRSASTPASGAKIIVARGHGSATVRR